jgi:hypothetical protein
LYSKYVPEGDAETIEEKAAALSAYYNNVSSNSEGMDQVSYYQNMTTLSP